MYSMQNNVEFAIAIYIGILGRSSSCTIFMDH